MPNLVPAFKSFEPKRAGEADVNERVAHALEHIAAALSVQTNLMINKHNASMPVRLASRANTRFSE
jgi:hypothetical protein